MNWIRMLAVVFEQFSEDIWFFHIIGLGCVKLLIKIIALDPRLHLLYKYATVAFYMQIRAGSIWHYILTPRPQVNTP